MQINSKHSDSKIESKGKLDRNSSNKKENKEKIDKKTESNSKIDSNDSKNKLDKIFDQKLKKVENKNDFFKASSVNSTFD